MSTIESGQKLLETIAYGDAAGLPVETKTSAAIAREYGRIGSLLPTSENEIFADKKLPGAWSDDTQLSIAVARALVRANGFDLKAMVESHVEAYDDTPTILFNGKPRKQGWGTSTSAAIRRLKHGATPETSGTVGGSGNGVLMKLAPLSFWHHQKDVPARERYANIDALTRMTHDSPEALVTARVHDDVLQSLMNNGYNADGFIDSAKESALRHERALGAQPVTFDALLYLHRLVNEKDILNNTDNKGFYAPQTLAMAYGAFVANRGMFKESVYGAVNLGGDTDSNASIVAGMSILADGTQNLPDDSYLVEHQQELSVLSAGLTAAAKRR